ncbi:hypothetical protein F2Q69_00014664 [Brassica cretica]|uniref:Uncharacterized protein n=1 Tax=Brassica cretica TaxID=69181 RepID=A0A8S9QX85_BRACR|nr:hypothetical protein F2Q69_00014664 [Brassica cretica]
MAEIEVGETHPSAYDSPRLQSWRLLLIGSGGTKWHNSSGSVDATLPSATLRPELLQSKRIHFCFGLLVELVLPGLYNSNKMT